MNFIQKYNINKQLGRFVKHKKKEGVQVCSWKQAQNICLLYTFETAQQLQELTDLLVSLRKKKNNIIMYCYISEKEKMLFENSADTYFISEKDFGFSGILRREKRVILQKQFFDILIHIDKEPSLFSLCLSAEINAKFRIGQNENTKKYNDIIIYSSNERYGFEDYFQSIEKYTEKIIS